MWRYLVSSALFAGIVVAQDMHLSLSSLYQKQVVSPSLTGLFNGTARVSAIYRNQWNSIANYTSFLLAVDGALAKNTLGAERIGIGIIAYRDMAGDMRMGVMEVRLSGAYHKILSERNGNKFLLSAGVSLGYNQRGIYNEAGIRAPEQWTGTQYQQSITIGENFTPQALADFGAGASLVGNIDKLSGVFWFSVFHPIEPTFTFSQSQVAELSKLYRKWGVGFQPKYSVSANVDITGGTAIWYQGGAFLFQGYAWAEYKKISSRPEPAADKPVAQKQTIFRVAGGFVYDHTLGLGPVLSVGYRNISLAFFYQVLLPKQIKSFGTYTPEVFAEYIYVGNQETIIPRY